MYARELGASWQAGANQRASWTRVWNGLLCYCCSMHPLPDPQVIVMTALKTTFLVSVTLTMLISIPVDYAPRLWEPCLHMLFHTALEGLHILSLVVDVLAVRAGISEYALRLITFDMI